MKNGFTLIELLVVVLIIGILSAIALPQYRKAVDKAKYTQAIVLLERIWQAEQVYKLANGNYALTFTDLDVDMPTPISNTDSSYNYSWGGCFIESSGYLMCIVNLDTQASVWYMAWPRKSTRACYAHPKDSRRANALCQTMTHKSTGTENGFYMTYSF